MREGTNDTSYGILAFFFYLWIDNYLATPTQTPNQASQFAEATSNEIPRAGEWNFFLINMKELEVLEIASGLSKQALAMMFPRKCLWPETWIRNEEAHSTSWKVKFPHHWFLSLQCRAAPENVFSSLSLGNGLSISPCWSSNGLREKHGG